MNKKLSRIRRGLKTRIKLKSCDMMRLVIHRTSRHMYAQIIDPISFNVVVSASTLEKSIRKNLISYTGNQDSANYIGDTIAKRALKKGISTVSFDRSGFKYHGRVKMLAESARKSGLKF
ncbi:50S ribosomal protein L18 [Buchnera aphidicola]